MIKGWYLRQGSTEWETDIAIHDQREPTRMLAGGVATGIPREPGLKTRQGTPKPKGSEVESWNPETERGYGGGGRSAIDEAQAVDDAFLEKLIHGGKPGGEDGIAHANVGFRLQQRALQKKLAQEARLLRERKRGKPQAVSAIERRVDEASKRLAAA